MKKNVGRDGNRRVAGRAVAKTAEDASRTIEMIVETPKGSRIKYAFDPERKIFTLKRVLPAGMTFPLDFGFLPGTKAPDGDPLDVLLISDEPSYPGVAVKARLIAILEAEQTRHNGESSRNDRLLAVAEVSETYAQITQLEQLPEKILTQLEDFFVNYHRLQGTRYQPLGWKGVKTALATIERLKN